MKVIVNLPLTFWILTLLVLANVYLSLLSGELSGVFGWAVAQLWMTCCYTECRGQ